jgi:prepilin-type N-terminal cleavage/methylation domain-containing protein
MNAHIKTGRGSRGFTLLELLIVIAIIAVLSVVLIIVINPAETLKKSRDAQRISDLSTMKTAIGIFTTSTSTVYLAGSASNAGCKTGAGVGSYGAGSKVYYSLPSGSAITDATLDGGSGSVPAAAQVAAASVPLTDGTGWLPINFDSLTSGSPVSNLPVDPINTVASLSAVAGTDLVYRYACNSTSLTYELDATLESTEYTSGANNKLTTDGGNNSNLYESGTNLKILGAGADF